MAILDDVGEAAETLARCIEAADRVVAFTGAGISTECGVPDFRSPGSPWLVNKPIPYAAFVASPEARQEAWRRKFAMDDSYRGARPGRGHRVLAALVAAGRMPGIITQNIDGLHGDAGVPAQNLVEIHGNGTYAACLGCEQRHELAPLRAAFEANGAVPPCEACGGLVKSATISFGQAMPALPMRRALALTRNCDLFLAIGSSLVVHPAATLPLIGKAAGARLIILNAEATPVDEAADVIIRGEIGPVLAAVAARLGLVLEAID